MKRFDSKAALLAVCIGAALVAAILTARTPSPLPVTASLQVFSAQRAMVDDRTIAARPHPEGSAAALQARDYIVSRMSALGLNPRRVAGEAVEVFPRFKGQFAAGGGVENLIGVLPGTDPKAQAILLMAHSDSVPGSPGAADDAAGVISTLEIVRVLKAVGPHARDVIVLITDGEETGLLGARAFFSPKLEKGDDPLLNHIGMVVNMEARGGGGRAAMFETGADNGAAIGLFAKAVKNTDALSLMSQIYKYLPNSTDFTVSKGAGYPGYNFAFLAEEFDYHSPSSTPAVLDQGSVQHMGDQALALTTALADAPTLPARSPDAIYTDFLGSSVIAYSQAVGWVILALSGVLAIVGAVVGARKSGQALQVGSVLRGAGAALLSLLTVALVLHTAGRLISGGGDFVQDRKLLAEFGWLYGGAAVLGIGVAVWMWSAASAGMMRWSVACAALGVGALSSLVGFEAFGLILGAITAVLAVAVLGRPVQGWSGWLGVSLLGFALALTLQILSPPLTVAIIWPLLIGALAMVLIATLGDGRFEGRASMLIALLAGAAATVQMGHLATPVFVAVGATTPEALAVTIFMAAFALYPLLCSETAATRMVAAIAVVLGVAVLAVVALRDPATARTPRPVQAFYLDDATSGQEWRASALDHLDPWSKAALAGGGEIKRGALSPIADKLWLAPAPSVSLTRPAFTQAALDTAAGRAVTVSITPHNGGRDLRLYLKPSAALEAVTLNGHATELEPKPGKWVQLRWAAPSGPLSLRFIAKKPGALDLRYEEITDGLPPGITAPPKPADDMPWGLSDKTVLVDRYSAKW